MIIHSFSVLKKSQGFYFRRDKEFCHECRYCCTLMMCSYNEGTKIRNSNLFDNKTAANESIFDALTLFNNDQRMYKTNDYRCLKPVKDKPPEEWPYYEMQGFRAAKTLIELEKVKEIKYDNNFFNFEDPEVFRAFTNKHSGRQLWRKTYGFDFVSISKYRSHPVRAYQCIKNCYQAEYGKFANICRKSKGFFKCCLTKYDIFQDTY